MIDIVDDLGRMGKELSKMELYGASQTMIRAEAEIARLRALVREAYEESRPDFWDLDSQWQFSAAKRKLEEGPN